jgi:hypothetical protein
VGPPGAGVPLNITRRACQNKIWIAIMLGVLAFLVTVGRLRGLAVRGRYGSRWDGCRPTSGYLTGWRVSGRLGGGRSAVHACL